MTTRTTTGDAPWIAPLYAGGSKTAETDRARAHLYQVVHTDQLNWVRTTARDGVRVKEVAQYLFNVAEPRGPCLAMARGAGGALRLDNTV